MKKVLDKMKNVCYNKDTEREVYKMGYLEINTHDSNYPYTISDGWGGKIYLTEEGLKRLFEEIKETLDESTEMYAVIIK